MNEEIDLREYIEVIIRRWKWIVGLMVVSALAAGVASLLLPRVYEAKAGVLIRRSREEVDFETRLRTLSEEELLTGGSAAPVIEARRKTLVALVDSNAVATLVIDELGESLDPEERKASVLLTRVDVETRGDLILIKARDRDPTKAVEIANAWAASYVEYVNRLYSEVGITPEDIESQVAKAWADYQAAEDALVEFIAVKQIDKYDREISERQKVIEQLQDGITARTTFADEELTLKKQTLADFYSTRRKVDRLLEDAKALRQQMGGGTATASSSLANALSQILIQASAYTSWADLPVDIEITMDQLTGITSLEQQLEDLDGVIAALEDRRAKVQTDIDQLASELVTTAGYAFLFAPSSEDDPLLRALSARYPQLFGGHIDLSFSSPTDDPVAKAIDALQDEIDLLRQLKEKDVATELELTRARDLAWETYSTLARKQAEVSLAAEATGREVRFAVRAVEPRRPVSPKKKLNVAVGGVMGLMVGVIGAFGAEYLRRADKGRK